MLVLIKGAGDLASGVALRLYHCGFSVVMTEIARPTTVRCTVAFSRAVYEGEAIVEGITARLAECAEDIPHILESGKIAVLIDPQANALKTLKPFAVIDAILAKENLGTKLTDAPVVVALGPGFTAGADCHAVVETKRGHHLGRVLYTGSAEANTGVPGEICGYSSQRILRAGVDGIFEPVRQIRDLVKKGDLVATVGGVPLYAPIEGVIRGMLPAGTPVHKGMKSGDIDPRGIQEYCDTVSDKARAIAGGVLEAVLHLANEKGGWQ